MVRQTLKILEHLLQNFQSVFDHFRRLCIKGFKASIKIKYFDVKKDNLQQKFIKIAFKNLIR